MSELLQRAKELVAMLEKEENKNKVRLSDIPVGGKFDTGIGRFIVLEQRNGKTCVITEDLYRKNVLFDDECTDYSKSDLRELCDTEIYKEFANEFGTDNICTNVANLMTVDGQTIFGSIQTKVRPLTFDEVRKYNKHLPNNDLEDYYWTCCSWSTEDRGWNYSVAVVSPGGVFRYDGFNYGRGVRSFCILKSDIFVSRVEEE